MLARLAPVHRQFALYIAFGLTQLLIDWLGFMLLVAWHVPVAPANVMSRTFAAGVGYLLNGSVTFRGADGKRHLNAGSFLRYATLFVTLTASSTILVSVGGMLLGPGRLPLVKLAIEAMLAGISFLTMKLWVYNKRGTNP